MIEAQRDRRGALEASLVGERDRAAEIGELGVEEGREREGDVIEQEREDPRGQLEPVIELVIAVELPEQRNHRDGDEEALDDVELRPTQGEVSDEERDPRHGDRRLEPSDPTAGRFFRRRLRAANREEGRRRGEGAQRSVAAVGESESSPAGAARGWAESEGSLIVGSVG